jgi:hypothetical protein
MATEVELALTWIESTLSGDVTLQGLAPGGVFQTFQLPGITTPYVIVKHIGGATAPKFGGIAYADMHFQVVAAGPIASIQNVRNAASRITTLLTVTSQTAVTGGTIMASYPDQTVSEDEWVDSAKWNTTGNEYRVMAKAS